MDRFVASLTELWKVRGYCVLLLLVSGAFLALSLLGILHPVLKIMTWWYLSGIVVSVFVLHSEVGASSPAEGTPDIQL